MAEKNLETGQDYWSVSGSIMEQATRSQGRTWYERGSFHQYLWASYKFLEYHFQGCVGKYDCYDYNEWEPNAFTGDLTNDNPDYWKSGSKIGYVNYKIPGFTYCQGQGSCWWPLTAGNTFYRDSNTRQTYSFQLDVAGFLDLQDWATYASITSEWWWGQSSGCNSPDEPLIWGNSVASTSARIVQADCIDPYAYGG